MNKKKLLALAVVVVMIAILSFSTLAWFTDTDEVKNTFTIGSIEIVQHEQFTPPTAMIPVTSNETPADDPNYVPKVVTVENTGKNDAYVQTLVAVSADLDVGLLHIYDANAANNGWIKDSTVLGTTQIAGKSYHVYRYRYSAVLTVGSTTPAVIEGAYIDQAADLNTYDDNNDGKTDRAHFVWNNSEITGHNVATNTVDVYVLTQAVQAMGFDNADQALDQAFGNTIPNFAS